MSDKKLDKTIAVMWRQ